MVSDTRREVNGCDSYAFKTYGDVKTGTLFTGVELNGMGCRDEANQVAGTGVRLQGGKGRDKERWVSDRWMSSLKKLDSAVCCSSMVSPARRSAFPPVQIYFRTLPSMEECPLGLGVEVTGGPAELAAMRGLYSADLEAPVGDRDMSARGAPYRFQPAY